MAHARGGRRATAVALACAAAIVFASETIFWLASAALGVGAAEVVRERRAGNTWENVAFSLPFLEDRAAVYVASEPLHARRGVRYVRRQRAGLCARTHPVATYVPLERFWWKPGAALYELWTWLRDETARGAPG